MNNDIHYNFLETKIISSYIDMNIFNQVKKNGWIK